MKGTTDAAARKRIAKRVRDISEWMAREETMHERRMDWFRSEIELTRSHCDHKRTLTQPDLFNATEPQKICATCCKIL